MLDMINKKTGRIQPKLNFDFVSSLLSRFSSTAYVTKERVLIRAFA
jgi:hypothetical protein